MQCGPFFVGPHNALWALRHSERSTFDMEQVGEELSESGMMEESLSVMGERGGGLGVAGLCPVRGGGMGMAIDKEGGAEADHT